MKAEAVMARTGSMEVSVTAVTTVALIVAARGTRSKTVVPCGAVVGMRVVFRGGTVAM